MTEVFGLDPGKDSGIVTGWYDENTPFTIRSHGETGKLEHGGARTVGQAVENWWQSTSGDVRIICEDWTSGQHEYAVDARWACMPMGAMEYVANGYGVPISYRRPGPPKAITSPLLQASGYWLAGGRGHKRAALKHVLQQLIDEGHTPTLHKLYRKGIYKP